MKNANTLLVEEPTFDKKNNISIPNKDQNEAKLPNQENYINIIFRNQQTTDLSIKINPKKNNTISNIIDILYDKLKIDKITKKIRLFFNGRPLSPEENIDSLSKLIYLYNNIKI